MLKITIHRAKQKSVLHGVVFSKECEANAIN